MYKVIIAEDEMFVRLGIKMSVDWEALGMEVVADCANGRLALEAFEQYHPEIVITDIKMPIMDGMELIQKIREKNKKTRIIILTVMEEFSIAKKAITYGVSDYILKLTMTPEEMENVLSRVKMELEKMKGTGNEVRQNAAWQEKIIKNYIFYHVYDGQQFARLPLKHKNLIMAVMEIDNYEAVCEYLIDGHGSLVLSAVQNILCEMIQKDGEGLCIYLNGPKFLVLMSRSQQKYSYIARQQFLDQLERVRRYLKNYYKALVTFGISDVYDGFVYLPEMYHQCCEALKMKFFVGNGHNLCYTEDNEDLVQTITEKIIEALEAENEDISQHAGSLKTEILSILEDRNKNEMIRFFTNRLSSKIQQFEPDHNKCLQRMNEAGIFLSSAKTLEELIQKYQECCQPQYFARNRSDVKLSKTITDIISYISSHYAQAMTLDAIADYVEMSPNYICGLFKREMGTNLMAYIMQYRIQKAKELMLTTHLKSYEIAELVGFSDESYFSRCFKKITGMSPNEYRRNK
ncbi:MAG: response regulator [Clostridiales bacterium]|nr:response regulator [Clostridiales bacterium]